ncbi:MAG: hypothetical protein LBP26_04750 [Clostridiales bacterium]|jgi:hypothetical protein|nr:hypothetical protein [Clostridiales bacterium]
MTFPFRSKNLAALDTFPVHAGRILGGLDPDTLVIGHAFENDVKMIADVCKKYSLALPEFDYIDTNVCYNALKGISGGEHSLAALGKEFGVEFDAHNPLEDARAALEVVRACCKASGGLYRFLDAYGVTPGGFYGGVIRRCVHKGMGEGALKKAANFNRVFDLTRKLGQGTGTAYHIDSAVLCARDMSELIRAILASGNRLAATPYAADAVITNNLSLRLSDNYLSLKAALKRFGIARSGYDFSPKKIRGEDGRAITLTEYYQRVCREFAAPGPLDGQTVAFAMSVERRDDFDDIIKRVVSLGGSVSPRVDKSDLFVVESLADLRRSLRSDGRIRAYKLNPSAKLTELSKLF